VRDAERVPERERNALVRRADWRFLLRQEGEPRALVAAAGGLGRAAGLLWSAPAPGEPADLAVLAGPRARELAAAAARLRPGGELYAEWRRPLLGGARAVRRRLEAAGLADVRVHWAWPPPERGAQLWLPLGAPAAARWLLRSRGRPRARRRLLALLWRAAAGLGLLAPLCAVARRPGGAGVPEEPEPEALLLLAGGRHSTNKVVGVRFRGAGEAPAGVVKFARSAGEEDALRREERALRRVAAERPALAGVPRPLGFSRRCGRLALAESALSGRPLQDLLGRRSFPALAAAVTGWLAELAGRGEPQPRERWWGRLVAEPLAALERSFGSVLAAGETARARALLDGLPDLPLAVEQRDCGPWNLLVDGAGRVAVADWESAEPSGLPGLDLVYFLAYAPLLLERALETGRVEEAYAASLDPRTPAGAVVRSCEESYCAHVGLAPELLRPLRVLCFAVHAGTEYRRLRADGAPPETSFFLRLLRAELARQP